MLGARVAAKYSMLPSEDFLFVHLLDGVRATLRRYVTDCVCLLPQRRSRT